MNISALMDGASHAQAVRCCRAARKPTQKPQTLNTNVAHKNTFVNHDRPLSYCVDLANNPIATQASTAIRSERLVSFMAVDVLVH